MKSLIHSALLMIIFLGIIIGCKRGQRNQQTTGPSLSERGYMPDKKGMKLTYSNSDGSTMVITVTDVKDSAGYKTASLLWAYPQYSFMGISASMHNSKETIIIQPPSPSYYQFLQQMASQEGVSQLTHQEYPMITTIPHKDPVGNIANKEIQIAELHYLIGSDPAVGIDFTGTNHEGVIDSLETVTVPAGKFECVRVHLTNTIRFNGVPMPPVHSDIKVWYALGTGIVKTFNVNSKGETNLMELTKIEE